MPVPRLLRGALGPGTISPIPPVCESERRVFYNYFFFVIQSLAPRFAEAASRRQEESHAEAH
jgi:hypothetical protein